MLGNLSVVLIGLATIVAVLTFVGAHSSPLNIPSISKGGCLVSVSLLVVGIFAGWYPSKIKYDHCQTECVAALDDLEGEHGEADKYVSPARVQYKACHQGEKELVVNNQKLEKKAEELLAQADATESAGGFSPDDLKKLRKRKRKLEEKINDPNAALNGKRFDKLKGLLNKVDADLAKDPKALRKYAKALTNQVSNNAVRSDDKLEADCHRQSVKTCAMACFEPPAVEDCDSAGDEDMDSKADCADEDCAEHPDCVEAAASNGEAAPSEG